MLLGALAQAPSLSQAHCLGGGGGGALFLPAPSPPCIPFSQLGDRVPLGRAEQESLRRSCGGSSCTCEGLREQSEGLGLGGSSSSR